MQKGCNGIKGRIVGCSLPDSEYIYIYASPGPPKPQRPHIYKYICWLRIWNDSRYINNRNDFLCKTDSQRYLSYNLLSKLTKTCVKILLEQVGRDFPSGICWDLSDLH